MLTSLYTTFKLTHEQQQIWTHALRTERVTDDELIRSINAWATDTTHDNRNIVRSKFPPAIGELIALIRSDRQRARFRQQTTVESLSNAEREQARIHAHPAVREQVALSTEIKSQLKSRYGLDYTRGAHSSFMLRVITLCMADSEARGGVGIESVEQAIKIADTEMQRARDAKASRKEAQYA